MHKTSFLAVLSLGTLLIGCGSPTSPDVTADGGSAADGGGEQPDAGPPPTEASSLALELQAIKTFHFSWTDVTDATHYKLLENPDGDSEFIQVGDDIAAGEQSLDHIVPLYARVNAQYLLQSCNAGGCIDSAALEVTGTLVEAIGYVKASNTDSDDRFGYSLALSADGSTMAVGAPFEDSNASGVNGSQTSNGANRAGAVYVFSRSNNNWNQEAYVKASNTSGGDEFGASLALSSDGSTMAVGAPNEGSSATGVGGDQDNDDAILSGAVYLFSRTDNAWIQRAYLKASNTNSGDNFGHSLALSLDGNTIAVGASGERSNATGVNGDRDNNDAESAGAVYVFSQSDSGWTQQSYVKASNTDPLAPFARFGSSLALSANGNTMAVGAEGERSSATGVNGDQSTDDTNRAGAVYVFSRNGDSWSQQAYVKASNTHRHSKFGHSVALSTDGNTMAVGAAWERSNATGIDGDQSNRAASYAGAVYVFTRSDTNWSQQAYVKASNTDGLDYFGSAVALSADGNMLAVGAVLERSNATGLNGHQGNDGGSGAVYLFSRTDNTWSQQAYLKASTMEAESESAQFGCSLGIDARGTVAIGARFESSAATGIGGDPDNNYGWDSGAVYLY